MIGNSGPNDRFAYVACRTLLPINTSLQITNVSIYLVGLAE